MRHSGIDTWDDFLARGHDEPRELIDATAEAVRPSDAGVLFFSSGSTSKPKGILSAHRGVAIQMWRFRRVCGFGPDDNIRCWSANGFFWSGNFVMSLGATLAAGGCLVLQPTFAAAEALELMDAERVNYPFAWPHQWAQIEAAPNWLTVDLSSMRFADVKTPIARHPTVTAEWFIARPCLRQHRNIHDINDFRSQHAARGARRQLGNRAAGRDDQDRGSTYRRRSVPRGEQARSASRAPHSCWAISAHRWMRHSTQKVSSAPATAGTSTRPADCSGRAGSRTSSRRAVRMSHRSKSTKCWRGTPV